jgi:hypothetical protein
VKVLDLFLWFQMQVLTLWQGPFQCLCPFLRLVCWALWQWMLPLPIGQLWGKPAQGFEPRLSLVGWAIWRRWVLRSGPARCWFVSCHQSLVLIEQAWELELSFLVDHFSNSLPVSPRWLNVVLFSPDCGWVSSVFCPSPTRWRWNFPSVYLDNSFVQWGYNLDYVVPSRAEDALSNVVGFKLTLVDLGQHILAGPGCPRCLHDLFCSSLGYIFDFPK